MFKRILFYIFFSSHIIFAQSPQQLMMPAPKESTFNNDRFVITNKLNISVKGNPDGRIYTAATRFLNRLKGRTGLFTVQSVVTPADSDSVMLIEVNRPGVNLLFEDESYQLAVTTTGILLKAETDLGAMHGLETLLQLLESDTVYYFPGCIITDSPRFPWRGLLIDVARHYMPVDVIKRNIDAMAAVKMNVFHLHLTDDQGFRIECITFPKLHQLGSNGQYYTREQIKDIIKYAGDRGIRIVPEFDIPGHTSSWFVGYPELASGKGPYHVEPGYGVFVPSLNPVKEETYQFLDSFFREMTELFPDEYMHIGGDENNGMEWDANSEIKDYKFNYCLTDNNMLQAYFNKRVLDILTKYGKKMIGWDEILHPQLPRNIIIQSWRGKEGLVNAAKNGFQVILSNGYYIDLVQPASFHYQNDPLPSSIALNSEQKKLVLGGEATMWSELVTWETVDSRIWPRTAAIAERLWSPSTITNVRLMYERLDRISIQLEELGLTHEKNYEMFLRRLAGNNDISALRTFVDILEPIKLYKRISTKEVHYATDSPFTRVVDAARPDARVARHFNNLIDQFLVDRKNDTIIQEIKSYLQLWSVNHGELVKLIRKNPVLKEVETLSADLAAISDIGLESLNILINRKQGDFSWYKASLEKLRRAKIPRGQAEIAIIPGIQTLVGSTREE
jgi:hexosaminidase